jgi:hypothetical protein
MKNKDFDKVIGLQFLMSLVSLSSFDKRVITESLCDAGDIPVLQLDFQEFKINDLAIHQSFLAVF